MKQERPTLADMQLDVPASLREIVVDELHQASYDDWRAGKETKPITDETIGELMVKVYQRIESEALEVFKSNEPWALKAWAYSTILKDAVASEASQSMVEELMSPVVEWQDKQPFNPIGYYVDKLENIERKTQRTVECYMLTAARFVAKAGRKRHYTDEDVEGYLSHISKRYPNQCTYRQECTRLLQFLRRLPGADPLRKLPIAMPKMPDEFYQPTFSQQEVETIAWATVLDNIPFNIVVRLIVASVYGARRSELTDLSSGDIHLDGDKSTLYIRTKKGGQRKPQPIPQALVPLFAVPISPIGGVSLQRKLQRVCRKAGVHLPFRGGFHCFRRRTVTTIAEIEASDINIHNFMRWSIPRSFSMLSRYKQTPVEETDRAILNKHPMVKLWEEITPYLLTLNTSYSQLCNDNT